MATLRMINSQDSAGIGDDSAINVSSPQRFRMQENVLANKPEDSQGERRLESFLDINQDNKLDPGPSGIKQVSDHEVSRHEVKDKLTSADYIKGKLPGLVELTLPSTPELPSNSLNESWMGTGDPSHDSDDSTGADSPITDPFLESMPIPTFVRLKTRLQDPPPLTPAVKSQLTYCRSSLTRQRTFLASNAEEHTSKVECGSVGVMPSQEMDQSASTQTNASLGHISSSSKMNAKEEEKDALDEDYIANKKFEENKWLIVTQWCSLLTLVALLVCTNKIRRLEKVTFLGLNLWRWQALTLVIFCGHLISGWIMKLFVSLIEKHYLLKKKVLYFVYGLRHSVKSCIWLALVLGVWEVIFQGHEDTLAVNIMTRILWCLFTASISWMLKVLAVKVAANSFHRKAYFDRIQECVFNQYLLERLSGPPITPHGDCTDGSNTKQTVTNLRKHKGAAHSLKVPKVTFPKALLKVQSENLQSEIQIVGQTFDSNLPGRRTVHSRLTAIWHKGCRKLSNVRTPHLYGIHMQQDKSSLHTQDDGSIKEEIIGEKEAPHHNVIDIGCMTPVASTSMQSPQKMSAPQLPTSARSPDTIQQEKLQELTSDTVSVWTLKRLMKTIRNTNLKTYSSMLSHEKGDATINSEVQAKVVAKQVFYNMAKHGKKCITLRNFIYFLPQEQVGRAFALFETNENGEITKEAVMKWVVNVYKERRALCLTLNDNKTVVEKLHRVLNAVLVLILIPVFVLIFGVETPKILVFFTSVFLPSVFIFGNSAKNAFESLIFLFVTHPFDVGDRIVVDGQTMLVEEMNILNTILLSSSNEKVYYPNSLLSIKPISNYYRSPDQWDSIEFQIHMRTPVEKVAVLKERIQKYIDGLPQFWYPDIRVACKDIEDSNKMKMVMWMRHHLNFQVSTENRT